LTIWAIKGGNICIICLTLDSIASKLNSLLWKKRSKYCSLPWSASTI
jgi:hypothetical protein